ncbi:hypothetical protein [Paenarthrobacter sp. A20]|uniref:hypothetical protein n=1 Tax=Paenarthrobacter sp. A20 TaxID=2817891 RepID=UPI00209E8380|nr:hypothetical protein [Paenarthrobacter sp. A20]MCP1414386.1 hypothetical protein [Paenarthrobacter sp. A20]
MTDLRALLAPIRARLAAATPGPWHMRECSPYTERGRLEVNIWDETRNIMITNWCDDDEIHRPNAALIANAPTDIARLLTAIEAVTELAEAWQARGEHLRKSAESAPEDVQEALDDQGGDMIWHAGLIRTALAAALGSDTTNQEGPTMTDFTTRTEHSDTHCNENSLCHDCINTAAQDNA